MTDRSTMCPYRLTNRKQLLLEEKVSLFAMPFSPSVSFVWATWDARCLDFKEKCRFYRPQETKILWCKTSVSDHCWVEHVTQLLICMEWVWSSDTQHPMIWNHNRFEQRPRQGLQLTKVFYLSLKFTGFYFGAKAESRLNAACWFWSSLSKSLPQQCDGFLPNVKTVVRDARGRVVKRIKNTIIAIIHMDTTFEDTGCTSYANWL